MARHVFCVRGLVGDPDTCTALAGGLQHCVLVDGEASRGFVGGKPVRHGGHRRILDTQVRHIQAVDRAEQLTEHCIDLRADSSVNYQPAVRRVDPDVRHAADVERLGHQFVGNGLLEFAHLLPARPEALLLFKLGGTHLYEVTDDRARQQFLLGGQGDQQLPVDAVHQISAVAWRGPALGLHLQVAARHEGVLG